MKKIVTYMLLVCLSLMWTGILFSAFANKYQGGSYDGHAFAQSNREDISSVQTIPGKTGYSLVKNYPNPFNPSTRIVYWVSQTSLVTVKVFNLAGKEIRMLVHEVQTSGKHGVDFQAGNLAGGIYIYQIQIGNQEIRHGKMVLVK